MRWLWTCVSSAHRFIPTASPHLLWTVVYGVCNMCGFANFSHLRLYVPYLEKHVRRLRDLHPTIHVICIQGPWSGHQKVLEEKGEIHLLLICCFVPSVSPGVFQTFCYLTLTANLSPDCIDKDLKAWRNEITCPKPVKLYVWLLAFELECTWLQSLGITELIVVFEGLIYLKKASFLFFNILIFILMAIMVSIMF